MERVAASTVGLAAGPPHRFYVEAHHVGAVLADYRARADVSGHVELMVIPADVPAELRPGPGPVPLAVALADLLESTDARERHLAAGLRAAAPQAAELAVLA